MRRGLRDRVLVVALLAGAAPLLAQIHGVPPSVTSLGPFGQISPAAPPAGVTSLGPFGWSGPPVRPFAPGRFAGRSGRHNSQGSFLPYYAPYYVEAPTDAEPFPNPGPPPIQAFPEPSPPPPVQASPAPEPQPAPPQPATVLVFQDGHTLEVRDYAIVGPTLFNLGDSGPRKIALADLNLPATVRTNDDRGVEFALPAH